MNDNASLRHTPLHALHLELGARMVPFAGYEMPVQYPTGVMAEHRHTREAAGLFDVSHMGQARVSVARQSSPDTRAAASVDTVTEDAVDGIARAFERLVPVDVLGLAPGQQRYALFTNDQGGILDDLMVARLDDGLHVIVNAACKEQDFELMRNGLGNDAQVEPLEDAALLALQGPKAAEVLARLNPDVNKLVFMQVARLRLGDSDCIVSRSGYTGEDGFEISVPASEAEALARRLLQHEAVKPIGLGARDSLRLEAGLCLYGHDIDSSTTPVEASLLWALSRPRRVDGERALGYPGADVIARQIKDGVARKRIGLKGHEKVPVREGSVLYAQEQGEQPVGKVTSGTSGPTVGVPVAMGYVQTGLHQPGTRLFAEVRGKRVAMEVCKMPFVEQRYHRG